MSRIRNIANTLGRGIAYAGLAAVLYSPIGCIKNAEVREAQDYGRNAAKPKVSAPLGRSPLEEHILDGGPGYEKKAEAAEPGKKQDGQRSARRDSTAFWKDMERGAKKSKLPVPVFAYAFITDLNKKMWDSYGDFADATMNRDSKGMKKKRIELNDRREFMQWTMVQYRSRYSAMLRR